VRSTRAATGAQPLPRKVPHAGSAPNAGWPALEGSSKGAVDDAAVDEVAVDEVADTDDADDAIAADDAAAAVRPSVALEPLVQAAVVVAGKLSEASATSHLFVWRFMMLLLQSMT